MSLITIPQNDRPETEPLLLTAEAAANLLSISRAQFFKLQSAGKIPAPVRLGTRVPRWRRDELAAWIAADCPSRETWEKLQEEQTRRPNGRA